VDESDNHKPEERRGGGLSVRDETERGFADEEVRLQAQRRINLLLTLTCISGLGTLRTAKGW